ncbi:MAG: hypothetical protein CK426_07485 [Legionella sp.]|nr:MAG: hypothetical protein CK423_03960 [Legionella sp.]PJD97721.1 MAG: hypothetical protein CK426_07485 [Legionella sp.]
METIGFHLKLMVDFIGFISKMSGETVKDGFIKEKRWNIFFCPTDKDARVGCHSWFCLATQA